MKRKIFAGMLLLGLLLSLAACQKKQESEAEKEADGGTFQAHIVAWTTVDVTVTPLVEDELSQSIQRLRFSTENLEDIGAGVGDTVEITYTWPLGETDPDKIQVSSWRLVEKSTIGETTDRTLLTNEPPALQVIYGSATLKLMSGTAEWSYFDAEERTILTSVQCGLSPLDKRENYPSLNKTEERTLTLSLPVRADTMTVRCWPETFLRDAGQPAAAMDDQAQTLAVADGKVTLPEGTDGYVIEVMANWEGEGSTTSFGNAGYQFLVTGNRP